jgi:hypothetical protein
MTAEERALYRIDQTIDEAGRFICRASLWRERIKNDPMVLLSGSKEGGAAKRASLDLSRALVDFREGANRG